MHGFEPKLMVKQEKKKMEVLTSDESRFILVSGLKIFLIPLIAFSFIAYMIWIFMTMTHLFLETNGLLQDDFVRMAFYEHSFFSVIERIQVLAAYAVSMFLLGCYLGHLLLRPFNSLKNFAITSLAEADMEYQPAHMFSRMNLLSDFGATFFSQLRIFRQTGKRLPVVLPRRFKAINSPILDRAFLVQYVSIMTIVAGITIVFFYFTTVEVHNQIVDLAIGSLPDTNQALELFLRKQKSVLLSVNIVSSIMIFALYIFTGMGMIKRLNGATYAVFNALRKYLNGDYKCRIFVRQEDPVRSQAKIINSYLDKIEKEFSQSIDSPPQAPSLGGGDMPPPPPPAAAQG